MGQRMIGRRGAVIGMLALAGCGTGRPALRPEPAARAVPNSAFDAWVRGFRDRALAAGISTVTFDRAFANAGYLPEVIERDRNQTEFTRTLEDYLAIAASDSRVEQGRAALLRQAGTLSAIEARYGVAPEIVTAIWGLESRYGQRRGDIPVISSTATLAFDGRRGSFFERQLSAALRILERGDTTPERMVGSWAGAMGHTQFIPTSYQAFAVDFTGDGRRDIWSDDPTDALASAAAYLSRNGWQRGVPWGAEAGTAAAARVPVTSSLRPQPGGPGFVVSRNFAVIKTYNNSDSYAIGVGHLADRIAGGPPIQGPFPPDEFGLTMADRQRLQRRLNALGFDAGEPDGVIGSGTRAAIEAFQRSRGLPVTGTPSQAMLAALG